MSVEMDDVAEGVHEIERLVVEAQSWLTKPGVRHTDCEHVAGILGAVRSNLREVREALASMDQAEAPGDVS